MFGQSALYRYREAPSVIRHIHSPRYNGNNLRQLLRDAEAQGQARGWDISTAGAPRGEEPDWADGECLPGKGETQPVYAQMM